MDEVYFFHKKLLDCKTATIQEIKTVVTETVNNQSIVNEILESLKSKKEIKDNYSDGDLYYYITEYGIPKALSKIHTYDSEKYEQYIQNPKKYKKNKQVPFNWIATITQRLMIDGYREGNEAHLKKESIHSKYIYSESNYGYTKEEEIQFDKARYFIYEVIEEEKNERCSEIMYAKFVVNIKKNKDIIEYLLVDLQLEMEISSYHVTRATAKMVKEVKKKSKRML